VKEKGRKIEDIDKTSTSRLQKKSEQGAIWREKTARGGRVEGRGSAGGLYSVLNQGSGCKTDAQDHCYKGEVEAAQEKLAKEKPE